MKHNSAKTYEPHDSKISAGYIRVSTLVQEDESLSLDRQEAAVKAAGAKELFKDTDSGSKDDRKNLEQLMALVRSGAVDVVIVPRIDRLTRSLRKLLDIVSEFEQLNVNLKILDMNIDLRTSTGKVMITLIGMFAEWETDQLSERIKAERQQRRQKLTASDSCPFGYEVIEGKYVIDRQPFLCLLTDRPEPYPLGALAEAAEPFVGPTIEQLCRELVALFLEDVLPRTTLSQFFEKYGFVKPRYKSNGFGKLLYWTPSGFLNWLTNPVLQGHTPYLRQITVKKRRRKTNPDGPEIHHDTHPDQRLLSEDEAKEITSIIATNRRLGGGNFKEKRNTPDRHGEFAYQTGAVFCAQCGSSCTSKTSAQGKYSYFACRYSGIGCGNKKSVSKRQIEQVLIQHLVSQSKAMREAIWRSKSRRVSGVATVLQAIGTDDAVICQFLASATPRYEDLEGASSFAQKQLSRLSELEAHLLELEQIRHYSPDVERLKQKLRCDIDETRNASQSLLNKSAEELIFEGHTSYFWDGITSDDKTRVYEQIVHKIFIDEGNVTEILLKTQQIQESNHENSGTYDPEAKNNGDRTQ